MPSCRLASLAAGLPPGRRLREGSGSSNNVPFRANWGSRHGQSPLARDTIGAGRRRRGSGPSPLATASTLYWVLISRTQSFASAAHRPVDASTGARRSTFLTPGSIVSGLVRPAAFQGIVASALAIGLSTPPVPRHAALEARATADTLNNPPVLKNISTIPGTDEFNLTAEPARIALVPGARHRRLHLQWQRAGTDHRSPRRRPGDHSLPEPPHGTDNDSLARPAHPGRHGRQSAPAGRSGKAVRLRLHDAARYGRDLLVSSAPRRSHGLPDRQGSLRRVHRSRPQRSAARFAAGEAAHPLRQSLQPRRVTRDRRPAHAAGRRSTRRMAARGTCSSSTAR